MPFYTIDTIANCRCISLRGICACGRRSVRNRNRGLTLIELMVTLVIIGITLGVAVPSFQNMTTRNRIITETNEFLLAVNFARSEALKVGGQVSIQLTDPSNANNEVGPGYCVVDGNPAGNCVPPVIRSFDGVTGNMTMNAVNDWTSIQFDSLGGLSVGPFVEMDLCHPEQPGRRVRINLIGRSKSYKAGDPTTEPAC